MPQPLLKTAIVLALAMSVFDAAAATPPSDTVVLNIQGLGAERLSKLKSDQSIQWSVELGNELLIAPRDDARKTWLQQPGARPGPKRLSPDTIRVRDHVCAHHESPPALGVVGGYELLRVDSEATERRFPAHVLGHKVPASGVVGRAVANERIPAKAIPVDARVQALVNQVNPDRWFQTVTELAAFNRNSFAPDLNNARDYIQSQFAAAGLGTELFPFTTPGTACNPTLPNASNFNVIGRKLGTSLPDEWIIIGAHYDSRNAARCDGAAQAQPGANDNASGCAGVIELARIFQNVETSRTMIFTCFAGEEQGLYGSWRYGQSLEANGDVSKVKHMLNLDMIGYAADDSLLTRLETSTTFSALYDYYTERAATYAPELTLLRGTGSISFTDHSYFLEIGIPSMFTWENGAAIYPHYHRTTDLPANMTRAKPLAHGILKMDTAVLADQAGLSDGFSDGFE